MKAGILTFFSANNYGAMLQALSLQKKVEELCGNCECIDYRCPAIEAVHKLRPFNPKLGLKKNIKNLVRNLFYVSRVRTFASFRERIPHSRPYDSETIPEANLEYDVFFSGSDQVFNLTLTGGDETYFLGFSEDAKRKVGYAASMGPFLEEKTETYLNLLRRFDFLSIRERSTATELRDRLGIECTVVPDPVFLHDAEEWKRMLQLESHNDGEKYVLIYSLFNSTELYRRADEYARKNGCKVYVITKSIHPSGKTDRVLRNVDPRMFVGWIANADYVVTDSFHGTAFSLIFNRQFRTVLPPKAQNRIVDLFGEIDLSPDGGLIDYGRVDKKLALYRERGIAFLNQVCS